MGDRVRVSLEGVVISRCRSCLEEIDWVVTASGKRMPVNRRRMLIVTDDGKVVKGRESHFATCPQAKDWSKSKNGGPKKGKE